MKFFLIAGLVPLISAFPAVKIEEKGTEKVHLTWFTDRIANKSSLLVTDSTKKQIYGHSCSDTLKIGNLKFSMDVDNDAQGHLRIGSASYLIHENPLFSGGITCNTIYDDEEAHIDCLVPWTAKFQPKALPSTAGEACLEEHLVRRGSYDEPEEDIIKRTYPSENNESTSALNKRQAGSNPGGTCSWYRYTERVGNGNPHQNFRHTQISEQISCGNGECQVGWQSSQSYTIGWEATGNLVWIAGGFSVSKSVETGNAYQCNGSKGQSVAIRYKMALTAYTVDAGQKNICSPNKIYEGRYIIFSPNSEKKGSKHYCIRGSQIRWSGHTYLEKNGPAGGPEYWNNRSA